MVEIEEKRRVVTEGIKRRNTCPLNFTVPGDPVGKQRPRFGSGRVYTPTKTKMFEGRIYHYLIMNSSPSSRNKIHDSPKVEVSLKCYFRNGKHPDCDNVKKAVWDSLQGDMRLGNDKRFWGTVDFDFDKENPRTEVTVSWNQEEGK